MFLISVQQLQFSLHDFSGLTELHHIIIVSINHFEGSGNYPGSSGDSSIEHSNGHLIPRSTRIDDRDSATTGLNTYISEELQSGDFSVFLA